jgi:hypothetical protein
MCLVPPNVHVSWIFSVHVDDVQVVHLWKCGDFIPHLLSVPILYSVYPGECSILNTAELFQIIGLWSNTFSTVIVFWFKEIICCSLFWFVTPRQLHLVYGCCSDWSVTSNSWGRVVLQNKFLAFLNPNVYYWIHCSYLLLFWEKGIQSTPSQLNWRPTVITCFHLCLVL